ncbi:MAG TPA: methyltransferase domain-containing protein [Polyangia bacterium]|nr:methyltransferase domain-containing protein [Polyangia bacterium]
MAYSERLLTHGNFLTRLAHGGRYRRTLEMTGGIRGAVALDFGCGDAMILRRAYDAGIVRAGFGIDSDPAMRESSSGNFAGIDGFRFIAPEELPSVVAVGSCDLAICTETLEHVPNPAIILDAIVRYCRPGAGVVITVPIEVGPSLFGKQLGRYFAGLRRPYGYEPYRLRELFSAAVLWNARGFDSSHVDRDAVSTGHKGFDFRDVERALRERMRIEQTVYSPLPLLGPLMNSTVMWRCRTPERPS